ncbi:MAG: GPW/gp25 family protein [Phycisphaerae bacterium]|nr:GPW/gp25 family protein [Phycisphaerae bacterium]
MDVENSDTRKSLGFPFRINELGQTNTLTGDDTIRAKIAQVLLTSPGERVNLPEFGCGLRDLVFDPNNDILAATTEFTVSKALQRWLGDDIIVESVDVSHQDATLQVEVVYIRRDQLNRGKVKIAF